MHALRQFVVTRTTTAAVAVLFIAGIAVYANTLNNKMFWDDNDVILNNAYVHNFEIGKFFSGNMIEGAGFMSDYWRPVLLTVYSIEWKLWGASAPGYHAVNFLVHFANAVLVFLLLSKLLARRAVPFFTALIFLIHPLQTEAVTYVTGLGDPLSLLFTLLGIAAYMRFRAKYQNRGAMLSYGVAALCFILALLSKERAVVFPALLVLLELWLRLVRPHVERFRDWCKNAALALLPFVLIAALYLALRGTVLNFQNTFNIYHAENVYTTSMMVRTSTFFSILPQYISLFFSPITLFMERTENILVVTSLFNPYALAGVIIALIMLLFSIARFKERKGYLFGTLFFAAAILPASGILAPVAGIMFEHYLYAPIVGLSIFAGTGIAEIMGAAWTKDWMRWTAGGLLAIWFISLGVRTVLRNADWRDPIGFYEQTLKYAPTSLRVWNNLGMAYEDKGDIPKAHDAYEHAIALNPQNPIPVYNLGNNYENAGDMQSARKYWEAAKQLDPKFLPAIEKLRIK
ncbi:MAG: tetratricopeptide repeat protein [Candidatus Jorgensenbacteria bacterium]